MADDNKTATGTEPNTDTQTDDGVQNDKKYFCRCYDTVNNINNAFNYRNDYVFNRLERVCKRGSEYVHKP